MPEPKSESSKKPPGGNDLRLAVRLSPKASRNAINGWFTDAQNNQVLKVSVTAVPEKGKANESLRRLLSENLDIPLHRIILARGETDRNKILIIKDISGQERGRIFDLS